MFQARGNFQRSLECVVLGSPCVKSKARTVWRVIYQESSRDRYVSSPAKCPRCYEGSVTWPAKCPRCRGATKLFPRCCTSCSTRRKRVSHLTRREQRGAERRELWLCWERAALRMLMKNIILSLKSHLFCSYGLSFKVLKETLRRDLWFWALV